MDYSRRKWRSGKTIAISIPITLVARVLAYAQGLDEQANLSEIDDNDRSIEKISFARNSSYRNVDVFFDDCCCVKDGNSISATELHEIYQAYCRDRRGVIPMGKSKFRTEFAKFAVLKGIYVAPVKNYQHFHNITLKDDLLQS